MLSLQGRSDRFKSCYAHGGFSEIKLLKNVHNPTICKKVFNNYYKIMKYKKDLASLFVLLAIAWPASQLFRNTYTPSQVILAAIFSYIGIRLTYFVYFKN